MKRSFALSLCTALLATVTVSSVRADDLQLELIYGSGTWELYATVIDNADPADGSNGIAAVRALIDGIDFGTGGDAVTLAGGIGAINPVQTSGGPVPPVLLTSGGTVELLYGQDTSDAPSVVGGVGVGTETLIASGTYTGDGSAIAFGDDDNGETSDGNFLDVAAPGPFGNAVAPDNLVLMVTPDVIPDSPGDFDASGAVGNSDLTLLLDNWGAAVPPVPDGWVNDLPTPDAVGNDDLTRLLDNWGNVYSGGLEASTVPEPSTMMIALAASLGGLAIRRRS